MLRKVLLNPPYTATPAARQVSVADRFSKTLPLFPVGTPASVAENSANPSSPVARASLLLTVLFVLPLVMFTPSANVFRIRALLILVPLTWTPQYMQTVCSTHTSSIVRLLTFCSSPHTLPGPSIRLV